MTHIIHFTLYSFIPLSLYSFIPLFQNCVSEVFTLGGVISVSLLRDLLAVARVSVTSLQQTGKNIVIRFVLGVGLKVSTRGSLTGVIGRGSWGRGNQESVHTQPFTIVVPVYQGSHSEG